jgi:hypothetical protein
MRVWLVFTILWAGLFLGLAVPGLMQFIDGFIQGRADQERIESQVVRVKPYAPARLPPTAVAQGNDPCFSVGYKCFDVTAPNGSRYVVRDRATATDTSIVDIVRWNTEIFSDPPQGTEGGYGNGRYYKDLTKGWVAIGVPIPILDQFAKICFVLAFLVPLAVLASGYVVAWIVKGFQPK